MLAFREMDAAGSPRRNVHGAVSVAATCLLTLTIGVAGPVLSMVLSALVVTVICGPVLIAALDDPRTEAAATPRQHADVST